MDFFPAIMLNSIFGIKFDYIYVYWAYLEYCFIKLVYWFQKIISRAREGNIRSRWHWELHMGRDSDQFDFLALLNIPLVEPLSSLCDIMSLGDIPCLITLDRITETHYKIKKTKDITSNFWNN